jgi:hypothetical protein
MLTVARNVVLEWGINIPNCAHALTGPQLTIVLKEIANDIVSTGCSCIVTTPTVTANVTTTTIDQITDTITSFVTSITSGTVTTVVTATSSAVVSINAYQKLPYTDCSYSGTYAAVAGDEI